MIRKILGIVLILFAVLILVGAVSNESFFDNLGTAVGTLLPVVANVCAGIFLLGFDKVNKFSYIDGWHARSKQCSAILAYIVVYALLMFMSCIGGLSAMSYDDSFILVLLKAFAPYFVPLIIFATMAGIYAVPYWRCKKHCQLNDAAVEAYLSIDEFYFSCTQDNSVIYNNQALFFPRAFCIIPFDMIADVKFYNALEQDIIFTLTNGKKLEIVANKKQFDGTVSAINAHNGSYPA